MTIKAKTIKSTPEAVARATFDGVDNGEEDIFPDPMSQTTMAASWRGSVAKALEHELAAFLPVSHAA